MWLALSRDTGEKPHVMGRIVAPLKRHLPGTWKCDLIWGEGCFSWNQVKDLDLRSSGIWVGPKSNDKKEGKEEARTENTHRTWGRRPRRHRGRLWRDVSPNQGMPSALAATRSSGRGMGQAVPQIAPSPADTLIPDFWPPEL